MTPRIQGGRPGPDGTVTVCAHAIVPGGVDLPALADLVQAHADETAAEHEIVVSYFIADDRYWLDLDVPIEADPEVATVQACQIIGPVLATFGMSIDSVEAVL